MTDSTGRPDPAVPADPAHGLLAERLGSAELTVTSDRTITTPDGRRFRQVFAALTNQDNTMASVVVDVDGNQADPTMIEERAGRRLFTPDVGGFDVPAPVRVPVTIDPDVNDLTLAECANLAERITVVVPPTGTTPKADVYLLADTTASMSGEISAVKAGALAIVNNPALAGFDVAYGVGNYRDFPVDGVRNSYAFQHQQSPTTVAIDVQNALNAWSAGEGSDGPEGQLFALQQIATDPAIGWRPDAKRILVWFGDAPGHDPICTAMSGAASDVTELTATAALVAASIAVIAVSTPHPGTFPAGIDDDPTTFANDYVGACVVGGSSGQATRISAATPGGSLTVGVNASTIVATLAALIAAAVKATGNVSLVPTGASAQFIDSISPPGGFGPLAGDVQHTLPFDVAWRGTVHCGDVDQVFTGTIDVVADGVVVAHKRVRITVPACRYHHVIEMVCGTQPELGNKDDAGRRPDPCTTLVPGRYATAVTIYNPGPCPATVEKFFAPLLLNGEPVGREPRTVPARAFARIGLLTHEATMDDCCTLAEAVRLDERQPTVGVLDIVSDRPLVVTGIYTSTATSGPAGAAIHTRTVIPYRD